MQCENETCRVLLNHVVPLTGSITTQCIFLSAMPVAVRLHRWILAWDKASDIPATINSVPYAWQFNNCLVWVFYSFVLLDYYVYVNNALGLIFSLYYFSVLLSYSSMIMRLPSDKQSEKSASEVSMSTLEEQQGDAVVDPEKAGVKQAMIIDNKLKHQLQKQNTYSLYSLLGGAILISLGGMLALITFAGQPQIQRAILGIMSVIIQIGFLVSPLSAMAQVIRDKDSRWLYWPLAVTVVFNGLCWGVYGLVLSDAFIYAPNFVGAALGLVQVFLISVFPAGGRIDLNDDESN